jgi:hypothetical protein
MKSPEFYLGDISFKTMLKKDVKVCPGVFLLADSLLRPPITT